MRTLIRIVLLLLLVNISTTQAANADDALPMSEFNLNRILFIPSSSAAKTFNLIEEVRSFSGRDFAIAGEYSGILFLEDNQAVDKNSFTSISPYQETCDLLIKQKRSARLQRLQNNKIKIIRRILCRSDIRIYKQDIVPNDAKFSELWGLRGRYGIKAPQAWHYSTGSRDVVIGVIDTGIDINHPDLKDNIWKNPFEIGGNGIDDDRNGYVDDVNGWDFFGNDNNPVGPDSHGTHVAGTIGASANNSIGVTGVNWNVSLIPLKIFGDNGAGNLSAAIKAFDYVSSMYDKGIRIVATNNSWGTTVNLSNITSYLLFFDQSVSKHEDRDILMIAAAGNVSSADSKNNPALLNLELSPVYPASLPNENVVSVAAIENDGSLAEFSKYGNVSVDIAAPGGGILSTFNNNQYGFLSGTSMAAPHVTGAIALIAAYDPNLTTIQVRDRLMQYGTTLSSLNGRVRSGKTINVLGAMTFGQNNLPIATSTPSNGKVPQQSFPTAVPTVKRQYTISGTVISNVFKTNKLKDMIQIKMKGKNVKKHISINRHGAWLGQFEEGEYTLSVSGRGKTKFKRDIKYRILLDRDYQGVVFAIGDNRTLKFSKFAVKQSY